MNQPDDIEELLGRVWCERYQLLEYIGRGGMGAVFKARQVHMGREVALKVIHRRLCQDDKQIQRFEQEARTSSKLNHPNSIRVFDYGTSDDGRLFMAMEFLKGKTLGQLITDEGTIHPDRVAHIARQMFKSLAEAHELGLVHRDLKPENIFICEIFGETDFVKVLDFGIAKAIGPTEEDAKLTQTGFICGTPRYLSPEQALGQAVDGRADLYSVGVLIYEMLTGRPPFIGENPISIVMKHVHDDPPPIVGVDRQSESGRKLIWLVEKLLEKNPARRPCPAGTIVGFLDGEVDEAELSAQLGSVPRGGGRPRSLRHLGLNPEGSAGRDVDGAVPRSAFRDFGAGSNTTTSKRAVVDPEGRVPTPVPQPPPLPREAIAGHSSAMRAHELKSAESTTVTGDKKRSAAGASVPESDETALIARPASLQAGAPGQGDTKPGVTAQLQSNKETRLISQEAVARASRQLQAAQSKEVTPPEHKPPSQPETKDKRPRPRPAEAKPAKSEDGPLWAWALAGVAIAVMVLSIFTYAWSSNQRAPEPQAGVTAVVAESTTRAGAKTGEAIARTTQSAGGVGESAQPDEPKNLRETSGASAEPTETSQPQGGEGVEVPEAGAPEMGSTGAAIGARLGGLELPAEAPEASAEVAVEKVKPAQKESAVDAALERELRAEERRRRQEEAAAKLEAEKAAAREAAEARAAAREAARAERAERRAAKRAADAEKAEKAKAERAERAAKAKAERARKAEQAKLKREERRLERELAREAAKIKRERARAEKEAAAEKAAQERAKKRAAAKKKKATKKTPAPKPKPKPKPKQPVGDPFEPF